MSRTARTKTPTAALPHDALLAAIVRQAVTDYQDGVAPHDQSAAPFLCALGVLDEAGHWRVRGRDWDGLRTPASRLRRERAAELAGAAGPAT